MSAETRLCPPRPLVHSSIEIAAPQAHPSLAGGRSIMRAHHRLGGAAAVELAILLPQLVFLFVIALDFARGYYFGPLR
jgi:Flp pilus assembly protein TadG